METLNGFNEVNHDTRGQQQAFALASLAMGAASFVTLLGVEKAILAIVFGVLALRPGQMKLQPGWAKVGMILGGAMILGVSAVLWFGHEELLALGSRLKDLS